MGVETARLSYQRAAWELDQVCIFVVVQCLCGFLLLCLLFAMLRVVVVIVVIVIVIVV